MAGGGLGVDRVATARLIGRRPEPGDSEAFRRIFTDPRTPEAVWPADLRTTDRAQSLLDEAVRHWERFGFGIWTVLLAGRPIGWTGLRHTYVGGRPEVELMWFIDPDHWNQGYATEMARESVRVGFDVLELDEIAALTMENNGPSRAVMEKLGMRYERDLEHAGLPHVLYRLHRET
jgi:[ribosomal protein S5]-alanine N-acetyltransferase